MKTFARARDAQPMPGEGWRGILRGLLAVAVLFATALDALVTALAGIPPLAWLAQRISRVIADEYRRGYRDAIDAEVIPTREPGADVVRRPACESTWKERF